MLLAFEGHGVDAEPVVYSEEWHDAVRTKLLCVDGVLVWVDPISDGRDRSRLDPMLSEIALRGVSVYCTHLRVTIADTRDCHGDLL